MAGKVLPNDTHALPRIDAPQCIDPPYCLTWYWWSKHELFWLGNHVIPLISWKFRLPRLAYLPPFSGAVLGHYKPILPRIIKIDQQMFERGCSTTNHIRWFFAVLSARTTCDRFYHHALLQEQNGIFFCGCGICFNKFVHWVNPYSWLLNPSFREKPI